jgi:hypothetical protein
MTVAWHPSPVQAAPRGRGSQLPWIGWGLVAAWSLMAVIVALYSAVILTLDGRATADAFHFGVQARFGLDVLLYLGWFTTFNLAFVGLVIGVVSTVRRGTGRLWRSVALVVLVIGGGIAEVWGLTGGNANDTGTAGYVSDVRLHAIVTCVVAFAVVGGTAALLGLFPSGRDRSQT